MNDQEFERMIARQLSSLPIPEGREDVVVQTVLGRLKLDAPSPSVSTRRSFRPGFRRRLVVAIAIVLVLAATAAAVRFTGLFDDGLTILSSKESRGALQESSTLSQLPWIDQKSGGTRIDQVPRRSSLVFPAGTTYSQALNSLVRSVITRGTIPAIAKSGPALPKGVVWRAGSKKTPPALDLSAPVGYALPSGIVRIPSLRVDRKVTKPQAEKIFEALRGGRIADPAIAKYIHVDVPILARCQVIGPGKPYVACKLAPPPKKKATGTE